VRAAKERVVWIDCGTTGIQLSYRYVVPWWRSESYALVHIDGELAYKGHPAQGRVNLEHNHHQIDITVEHGWAKTSRWRIVGFSVTVDGQLAYQEPDAAERQD
jgi:hypothetical protein